MFDTHQSLYCDQSPTRPDVNATRIAYIFPCPNELWLAQGAEEWCYKVSSSSATSSLSINPCNGSNERSSYHQHFLLCSFLSILPSRDLRNMTPNHPEADTSVITSTFPNSLVAHSYLQFCYAPLRDILAVTGETWVFGRKVSTSADFDDTKRLLYTWSMSQSAARATWHACHILRSSLALAPEDSSNNNNNRDMATNSICAYWSVYIAALICWAFGHRKVLALSVDEQHPTSASTSDPELQATAHIDLISTSNWQDLLNMPSTRAELAVVQAVRQRLEVEGVGGQCGMLVDAIGALGRLLEGGRSGKWF